MENERQDEDATYAQTLEGRTLANGWHVDHLIKSNEFSGGYNSVSYEVSRDGEKGFLKVYDLQGVLKAAWTDPNANPMLVMNRLTSVYLFEVELLKECRRMSRVVNIVDSGDFFIEKTDTSSFIPYIICELADCDIRAALVVLGPNDVAWRLATLHHVAIGVSQLHGRDISHNDLKQANVLVTSEGRKLGDLGSGTRRGVPGPNDVHFFPGDKRYAPPEVVYGFREPDWVRRYLPANLFGIANIATYLFTQLSMCKLLMHTNLAEAHRTPFYGGTWTGTFGEVSPYLLDSFSRTLEQVADSLPPPSGRFDYRPELMDLIRRLGHPIPEERGFPDKNNRPSLSLERVISKLNALEKKSGIRPRSAA